MIPNKYTRSFLILFLITLIIGCNKEEVQQEALVSENFESGSIGEITKLSDTKWELSLADDNDNSELPDRWRNWWYVKMGNLFTNASTEITLKNRGWPYYYLPVYSYDQKKWYRFNEDEVSQNEADELIMRKQFDHQTVWIARFYPYTFTHLNSYINSIMGNPYINIQIPGYSQGGKPIYLFKITNSNIPASGKKRILMHARTHPAETPSSFLIEGMINFLLTGTQEVSNILSKFEFYIFPMQNVDGVIAGNYRSTPQTENLEVMWYYDVNNPLNLTDAAPQEVNIIHEYAKTLMSIDDGQPISMALNLHASNSEKDIRPFFFPHFGTKAQGYSDEEASLWEKQIRLINTLATHHGADMIEPIPEQGGRSFATKTYPESWWWANYKDEVMAITMEMTYGRAGYSPRWIEPDDLRYLGTSLILSIRDYYDDSFIPNLFMLKSGNIQNRKLKYPELYPPNEVDELKK
jgi:hypothetical protein